MCAVTNKIVLIGNGYWGSKIKKYIPEFFELKHIADSKFDKNIIWNDDEIDAVIIATPIETHYKIVKEALEHNKHVYVEKPITLKSNEAYELNGISMKKRLKIGLEYTQQFSNSLLVMYNNLLPKIGNLEYIEMSTKHLGRFMEHNVYWLLASHHLSVLNKFVDLDKLNFKFDDHINNNGVCTSGSIKFDMGRIDVSVNYPGKEMYINLYGDKGTIQYSPLSQDCTVKLTLYNKKYKALSDVLTEKSSQVWVDETNNLRYSIKYFKDLLEGWAESNIETAIKITEILENS